MLSEWEAAERAIALEYFIALLDELKRVRCYNVCMGIAMGLQSPHVERFGLSLCLWISFSDREREIWRYMVVWKYLPIASELESERVAISIFHSIPSDLKGRGL